MVCLHVPGANPLTCSCCASVMLLLWFCCAPAVVLLCSAAAGGASACLYNYVDKNGQGSRQAECEAPNIPHAGLKVTAFTKV